MKTLAEKVTFRMQQLGYTQGSLAKKLGLPQPTIQKITSGKTVRPRCLFELAKVLNVSPEYLTNPNMEYDEITLGGGSLALNRNLKLTEQRLIKLKLYKISKLHISFDSLNFKIIDPGEEFMLFVKSPTDAGIDYDQCLAVEIDTGSYASVFNHGGTLIVSKALSPQSGDKVVIQYKNDDSFDLAIYQSATRYQIIGATHTESASFQPGDIRIIGVIVSEINEKKHLLR